MQMRRKQGFLSSLDDTLPSPLTSRNPRPRSEARSSRSASSSRGGSARPSRNSSSLSISSLMPPTGAVAGPSSRGIKRERSGSPADSGNDSKRAREEQEVDELEDDDVETILLPSDIQALSNQSNSSDRPSDSSLRNDAPDRISPNLPPVSSPSLAKLLHPVNSSPAERAAPHSPTSSSAASGSAAASGSRVPMVVTSPTEFTIASGSKLQKSIPSPSPSPPPRADPEHLSTYSCPICFFPPTNATLTPCGHVCCGSCLFTAVKTMTQRGALMPEASVARCPVCRAQIPGWDGKGGGVIGLKVRAIFSL
ncbi:hypothetical protein FB451DRAFT_313418 [Mycena latifolia]|nr:hypothetical protein FB451DRAFT_313418 [Mycena latifolia]